MRTSFKHIFQLFFFGLLPLIIVSCTDEQKESNISIEGKLDNLQSSEIYLIKQLAIDSLAIDTIKVSEDGSFKFKDMIQRPIMVSLFSGEDPITFVLEPKYQVKIKGDALQPDLVEVKGGIANDNINAFKVKNANLLQSRYRILSKNEKLDLAELKNADLKIARAVHEYVEENPTKISSVVLMNEYSINNTSVEQLGQDINLLMGAALDFYLTTSLKSYYDRIKISAVGSIAPPMTLKSTKGKTISLSDFKGKPVLLIFDLKDAPSDEKYFDSLKEAQKKLKNKVDFISIIIDEDDKNPDEKILKIANALDWTVLLDGKKWNSKEVKKFNIRTAPSMLLISPDGLIEERDVALDSLVIRYTKENIEK